MSATSHPLVATRVAHPTVSVRTTGVASLGLFMVAFLWAYAEGHTQLAFWVLSGIFPFFTPASLAIVVAATVHGIGDWRVVVVDFVAAGLGLVTVLGSLRHLDEL
jgi:succinate dehydrogenase hydrophobic anchor subunit